MKNYQKPNPEVWTGRSSEKELYLHEKINCIDLTKDPLETVKDKSFAVLGYVCDEGVKRNQGRIGAVEGPQAIRKMMASLSNHFSSDVQLLDVGNMTCIDQDLEETQQDTSDSIALLLQHAIFPIVLGGGHDLAYAHYNGIKKQFPNKTIGIINLDAHFDLRKVEGKGNSGTPFFQIAQENKDFNYLCLGIQKESNNRELFEVATNYKVDYLLNTEFTSQNKQKVAQTVANFINTVDLVYLTIDIDGFSSAYAPGVSAPSPFGFSIDIAMETIQQICKSNKLISADLVELNPTYDIDNCTARLAARIAYYMMTWL
ncbi:formimidoylglutamase [Aquimarina gracilis]|uniref:Formimidoylglutamase n=1 Tax=Aquimarina gracilis TaxID=874422 RepID=A0ABU6A276_9FLAO|nr:formimidoylglutamase [Aquimarina gracilis]MEB3348150.1 formimidoylglutamase [Aquimarina gracilis]